MKLKTALYFVNFAVVSLFAQTHWTPQPLPVGASLLLTIDFLNYNNGFSGGWNFDGDKVRGVGVYTINGGDLWEISDLPDSTRVIINSKIFNNLTGIAAAAFNYIIPSNVNLINYIDELYRKRDYTQIPYALIGYVRGAQTGGFILKTTDAGASWNTITALPDSFSYITGAYFLDENIGFIIAPTDSLTHILKTSDGGISWQIKFTFPPNSSLISIVFSSSLNGIAAGYNISTTEQGLIAVTNDGGENWSYQFIPEAGILSATSFSDENTFYVTGSKFPNSYVFKSTNAGLDWFQTSFQSTEFFLGGINFLEGTDAGFVFGNTSQPSTQIFFIKTDDGGNSWSEPEFIFSFPDYIVFGSKILDDNNVYLSGGDYSFQGLILKTSDAALPVESDELKQPVEYSLEQNYPNPFNPATTITFQIPETGIVTLKVYDVLGNEVATLVSKEKPAGNYEIEFDGTNLPSGIYFYQLRAGSFVQTKKMVLMK